MIQDPQKKLYAAVFGILGFIVVLFFAWRTFFIRGQVVITGKAPYSLTIWKQNVSSDPENLAQLPSRKINCTLDLCTVPVDSGNYTLLIEKENFAPEYRQIKVSLGGSYAETVKFRFLPTVEKIGKRNVFLLPPQASRFQNLPGLSLAFQGDNQIELKNLPEKISNITFGSDGKTAIVITDDDIIFYGIGKNISAGLDLKPSTPIFYGQTGQTFFYLGRSGENGRQALYRRDVQQDGSLGNPIMVTSFLRDLQKISLKSSPDRNKILLVEESDAGMSLYFIDLIAKSRTNLLDAPYIGNIHWFPDGSSFILNAREKNELKDSTYLYLPLTQNLKKINFDIPLEKAVVVDQNNVIAVKTQSVPSSIKIRDLEGKAVVEDTGSVDAFINGDTKNDQMALLEFIDYSFDTGEITLIKALENQPLPEVVELAQDQKSIYFLQGDELSVLHLGDIINAH